MNNWQVTTTIPECCGNCKFRRDGRCHRNQPFIVIIGNLHKAAWPPVPDHEWCGEFKPVDVLDAQPEQSMFQLSKVEQWKDQS
jgi:hypothetical protein